MKTNPQLSIVMPCLNEAETVAKCVEKAKKFIMANNLAAEIVVSDNGSTDESVKLAQKAGARVVYVSKKGYGNALLGGIDAAQGKYVIIGDADDSYDFSALGEFVKALESGCDLVMGNRFKGGIKPGAMPFLHQYLGNPLLSWLGRLFFKINVGDFHCGLRGFRRDAILSLGLQTTGMEFASEMIIKASFQGLKIMEVPTILYPDGRSRPPHLRTWADGWRHLRFLLMFSPLWLFFYPGVALMVIGGLFAAWLLPGPRAIGAINLDINTLTYTSLLMILGLQSVLFFFYTKIFGITSGILPIDPLLQKLLNFFSLEKGLVIGSALIILGLSSSVGALAYWGSHHFGPIDPTISMRLVIPGTVLFSFGFQILFASFFLSILMTKRK